MFILFYRPEAFLIPRFSDLSEMLSILLKSEKNKMSLRATYKHFAAPRLVADRTRGRLF